MRPYEIVNVERRSVDLTFFVDPVFNNHHLRCSALLRISIKLTYLGNVGNLEEMPRVECLLTFNDIWQIHELGGICLAFILECCSTGIW